MMQVFSAFGFVHKITTFEKTAGFQVIVCKLYPSFLLMATAIKQSNFISYVQALVQFSDAETATSAKNALDGRSIPR